MCILLQTAQPPPPTENSGSSTSSGGSSNYGTLGRAAGNSMASMMDEMAKTLARRRAQVIYPHFLHKSSENLQK